jgi:erythromycin esterase-like protein
MSNTSSLTLSPYIFAALCALVPAHAAPQTSQAATEQQAAIAWVRQNAIPLKTVQTGSGFADMQPLDNVVGDARIVSLGEATHGTREFFQLKHRMIEYLATRKGFTIFSIEANMPEAYRLNKFVLEGQGDPKQLLKGMYFWTWNTEEVLDMILWMRDFNKSGKGHIEFTGFDMQTPTLPIQTVQDFLLARDPAYYHATVEALYKQVPDVKEQITQQNYAGATATIPGNLIAGKHVSVAGYMRSDSIADGYAGLWMNIVGAPKGSLAFKNLGDQNITGTTPWKRYEISLDIPANVRALAFGATQSGTGTAWLDAMEVKIDGKPYQDPAIDFGFESSTPKGFRTGGDGYEVSLDKGVAQSGAQSLRLRRLPAISAPTVAPVLASSVFGRCRDVLTYMEQNRARFLQAGSSQSDVDWAIQSARLVLQFVEMTAGMRTRDESMAENVDWIAKQNPDAKIVLWAHNDHLRNTGYGAIRSMGSYLRQMYGKQLVNFGFAFNEGSFRAVEPGKSLHDFTVPPAPEGTLDHALAATGIPLFAVDLRRLPNDSPAAQWFAEPHKTRSIGAAFSDSLEPFLWRPGPPKSDFDVLLFVAKTTAAHGNP